jgi:hypothetical protein
MAATVRYIPAMMIVRGFGLKNLRMVESNVAGAVYSCDKVVQLEVDMRKHIFLLLCKRRLETFAQSSEAAKGKNAHQVLRKEGWVAIKMNIPFNSTTQ